MMPSRIRARLTPRRGMDTGKVLADTIMRLKISVGHFNSR